MKTICAFLLAISTLHAATTNNWFSERLHDDWGQKMEIKERLFTKKSPFQRIQIIETSRFGKMLVLDGIVQTNEGDEFIYHEMLTHVPILTHGNVKKVLIIGGGDGGMLREVLRHESVEKAVMVEIDGMVIEYCKKLMPSLSQGAFDDPRAEVIVGDGLEYVKKTKENFDVIICDSTDPTGPGVVLFTKDFYSDCQRILTPNGILVTQNGVPFVQGKEITETHQNRARYFKDNTFYLAAIPSYIGGFMAFGWASNNPDLRKVSEEVLKERASKIKGKTRYYSPAVHKASFVLPPYVEELVK